MVPRVISLNGQTNFKRSRQVLITGNSDQQMDTGSNTHALIQQLQQQQEDSKKQYEKLSQQLEHLKTATGKSSTFKGSKFQQREIQR
jgi:hypothetical protein